MTEAEANAEIHRKGWYLVLPSQSSGRWRSFGWPLKGNQPALSQAEGLATTAPPVPQLTTIWGRTDACPGGGEAGSQEAETTLRTSGRSLRQRKNPGQGGQQAQLQVLTGPGHVQSGPLQEHSGGLCPNLAVGLKSPHLLGPPFLCDVKERA